MSTTLKTVTGAALAAAITLGGFTSAHAQFSNDQTYNVPFLDEPVLENVVTDDEQMDASSNSQWFTGSGKHKLIDQHYDWVGLKEGDLDFTKTFKWQGVDDFYHKGGTVYSSGANTYLDRLWVTTDTLTAKRKDSVSSTVVIEDFILQVGTTNVYGEAFGNQTADKPLVLNSKSITYNGKTTSSWGVDNKDIDTRFIIENEGGVIHDVTVKGGYLINNNGTIYKAQQSGGRFSNAGFVEELRLSDGYLDNRHGYIETLYWSGGGTINGQGNIGTIIYLGAADAGADEDWQDAVIDDVDFDAADWQGEEVMVW